MSSEKSELPPEANLPAAAAGDVPAAAEEAETPLAPEAGETGEPPEVLLLTLLESELAGSGAEGDQITLHGGPPPPADGPAKIETRLAVREALLPPRRAARSGARAPRCRACGGQPAPGGGGYCAACRQAAGSGGKDAAPPPCADCGRQFDRQASLVSHRTHEHSADTPHSCPFCSKTFQRRTDLKTHMNLHLGIKISVCDVCGQQFSHMSNLYRHRRIHTGERPYVCSICGKRFSQVNALNAHTETHEVKTRHKCPVCPKKFRNRPRLACHMRLMHPATSVPGRCRFLARKFHCGVCGARLGSLAQLRRHHATHPAASLRCGVCQVAFSTAGELTRHGCCLPGRHEEDEDEPADGSDAEEAVPAAAAAPLPPPPRLARASYMLSDSRERKEEEPAGLLAAAAEDSEVVRLMDEMVAVQSVGTQYDVNEILCLTEAERLDSPPPPPSPPPPAPLDHIDQVIDSVARGELGGLIGSRRFPCATCGRVFARQQNLRQHEAMHDASLQRFKCRHCDQAFAWQQTRDRHVAREHASGDNRVPCPDCGRMFLPESLRGHQRRIHMKLREFPCAICHKGFHRRSELDSHMRSHTQERPYVCSSCGRQFGHLSHLRRHEEKHRQAGEDVSDGGRPAAPRTYQMRRPGASRADIVQHSLESARIPLKVNMLPAAPAARVAQPLLQPVVLATSAAMQPGSQQILMPGAPPNGQLVTLVGPECTEIIIVECEV